MSDIDSLYSLPDISFIENMSLEEVKNKAIELYEQEYEEITGQAITLAPADPDRLKLYACSLLIYQLMQYVDKMGKMQLIKYSEGDFLKHLAAWKNVSPLEQEAARTTQRFYLQSAKTSVIAIPQGTRVTGDFNVFFETVEYAEIHPGEIYVDVTVKCTVNGTTANDIEKGYLSVLVDPIPYVYKTENLEETAGGTDAETDESLRERAYDAPGSYSTAGAELSYQYWVKSFSSDILDQKVISPEPDCIDIYIIMKGGEMPTETIMSELADYMDDETKRPLNDKITVKAPEQVEYSIDITYYISTEDAKKVVTIKKQIDAAIEQYKLWQRSKIGRDIDLGRLDVLVRNAGAKRTIINSTSFIKVEPTQIANLTTETVTYGGLEDE